MLLSIDIIDIIFLEIHVGSVFRIIRQFNNISVTHALIQVKKYHPCNYFVTISNTLLYLFKVLLFPFQGVALKCTIYFETRIPICPIYFNLFPNTLCREAMWLLLRASVVRQEWRMFSHWVFNEQYASTMGDWTTTNVHQCSYVCHDGSH